ncbi:c-type cytochrome [Rhodanobacter ginsengisoli]|uniref:Cytochrome c-551 n=1 Tax=Rhodanobacter ginsengisoli TaxID=418646 RepID=A0ABW0QTM0_9GAMM
MAIFIPPPMVGRMGHDDNLLMPLVCFERCHRPLLGKIIHQGETEMMNISRSALAIIVTGIAIVAFLPASRAADMDAAKTLARANNCFKCHAISRDKDGPGWKKVADKYKGNPDAEAKLIHHLTSGEMVKLADGSQVHHEIIKTDPANDTAQIKNLVDWILSL